VNWNEKLLSELLISCLWVTSTFSSLGLQGQHKASLSEEERKWTTQDVRDIKLSNVIVSLIILDIMKIIMNVFYMENMFSLCAYMTSKNYEVRQKYFMFFEQIF
jgi:hypothetical protein